MSQIIIILSNMGKVGKGIYDITVFYTVCFQNPIKDLRCNFFCKNTSVIRQKGRISKRVFQENKGCQIFQKTTISCLLIRTHTRESLETMRKLCVSTNFHTKKLGEITVFFTVKISTIFSYVDLMHMEFNYLFILNFFLENALNYLNIAVTVCTAT